MSTFAPAPDITRLRDLTPQQKRSGLAAWLGWLFDGLDMHLYTLVATAFVAQLMHVPESDPTVGTHGSIIQAAFLVGWALGGAFFGRVGDMLGRSRTLTLTILTYACFTGLSFFAQTWWQLMIFRFLAALGIGGEWAVGASLLSETWPKAWRPWIAATLQSAVNCGVLLACFAGWLLAGQEPRYIFLIGVLPAFITLWIRKAVPETEAWTEARKGQEVPRISALFGPGVRRTTWRVLVICAVSLTAHWTFLFWQQKHILSLPEITSLTKAGKDHALVIALMWIMFGSIIGNYIAGGLAKLMGYRKAIVLMMLAYFGSMYLAFYRQWDWETTKYQFALIGACQGVFGLFTMCLPPLFPVLLRTTGSGFCYNIGRIVAAAGTVFFGIFVKVGDYREALLYAGFLFVPATLVAMLLPEEPPVDHKRSQAKPPLPVVPKFETTKGPTIAIPAKPSSGMPTFAMWAGVTLIVSFLLPWVQIAGFSRSGYDLTQLGSMANWAWLVPLGGGATLIAGSRGRDAPLIRIVAGIAPWLLLIYGRVEFGSNLFHLLAIGAYISLAAGVALIFSSPTAVGETQAASHLSNATTNPTTCPNCESTIPADETKCPSCGWSYKS